MSLRAPALALAPARTTCSKERGAGLAATLSLDTRMIGLHVHPDSELAPTRSVSSNPLLMMSGYSPITPVSLKAAFDYDASILSESAMLRIDSLGAYDQGRRASSDDSALDLDFGTNDQQLPALSTGDSCSDAHSPATSWTDDSLARTSPDPPAYDLAPLEWDQFDFAAPLLKDAVECAETGNSAASRPSQQQHGLYPDRSNSILGSGLDQKPLASIKVPATNLTCSASNAPAVVASFPLEAPFGTTTTQSAPGQTMYSSAGAGEMAASPTERAAPFSYAPLETEGLDGHVRGGRHVSSTGLPPAGVYQNSVPAAGTAHVYDQRHYQVAYPHHGPDAGVSSVFHDHTPLYQLADPQIQSAQPHQQQHQPYLQPHQQGYNVGAAQGFVPVQFTTVTGVTYAVALPVATTPQAAAIETPHGTYFFVPSAHSQHLAPTTSAQPPNVPLGMLPTPPPTHEATLPVLPECPSSLPPPPISLNLNAEEEAEPRARAARSKPRSSPRSTKPHTAQAANKTRAASVQHEAPLHDVEKQQDRVGPAKSSSFQLPQGPSAAAIAAENAAKAAALVAALGPAHKIRLPVGQGKRGSTKRKHESPSKKASSRRFTCPHPGCGRGFARNFNMQSHYKSHLGVREYDCLWCNKKFSRRHDRARHCVTVHDAVVDREGTITGPHPVLERNKGKTSIKVEDDVLYREEGDHVDVDAEGDYNSDHHHHHLPDSAGFPGSPEERDPGEHRQSASASPYWG